MRITRKEVKCEARSKGRVEQGSMGTNTGRKKWTEVWSEVCGPKWTEVKVFGGPYFNGKYLVTAARSSGVAMLTRSAESALFARSSTSWRVVSVARAC